MKLPSFSLRKLLYNKRFTIPFSILMAFALWLSIMINQKPTMDRTFSDITVNVNLENTFAAENNMSIIGDISQQRFTGVVRGPNYIVGSLTSSDLSLYASAATVDAPGEYNLDVAPASANAGTEYEIISITPQKININFDYIETKEFTINASAEGVTASEGLIAESGVVSGTESNTVTIKGPRTVINKIENVVATAKVNKTLSASETFDADILLYDKDGETVDQKHLTLSTSKAKVTVPISKKKTVPVSGAFSNLPANFNEKSLKAKLDHPTVTIIGTPETIDKTKNVSLSPIDITAVSTSSGSFDVSPKLPDGVRLLDSIEHFTVTFNMENYAEKTITVKNFRYAGLKAGLKSKGVSEIVNVKVCGPESAINKLKAEQVFANFDLTDKAVGEHTVDAIIGFEGVKSIWQVGSYKTTVTIEKSK